MKNLLALKVLRNVLKNNFTAKVNVFLYFCTFIADELKFKCKDTRAPEMGFRRYVSTSYLYQKWGLQPGSGLQNV
jgi:hypothetical protein